LALESDFVKLAVRGLTGAVLVALTLIPPGCGRQPATDAQRSAPERVAPAERGRRRALADIAAGKLRVYRYGNPVAFDNPRTDPQSGLPLRTLLDCCVTGDAREETEAYNSAMRAAAPARRSAPQTPER
jgi:hypothetical protein